MKNLGRLLSGSEQSLEMVGRHFSMIKGIVTNNNDPENRRRIKATTAISPGIDTNWINRLKSFSGIDWPLPVVGSTVLLLFEEDNPLKGFYIQIENDISPPQGKISPQDDLFLSVTGIIQILCQNAIKVVFNNGTISIEGNIIIDGNVTISGDVTVNGNVSLSSSSVSINGAQVATIGAVDNAGEVLISRGW